MFIGETARGFYPGGTGRDEQPRLEQCQSVAGAATQSGMRSIFPLPGMPRARGRTPVAGHLSRAGQLGAERSGLPCGSSCAGQAKPDATCRALQVGCRPTAEQVLAPETPP